MNLRLLFLLLPALLAGGAAAIAQTDSYDDVMLIVNDRSWTSQTIAAYFASHRGVPERHICHIDVDTVETMDSATFIPLKWKIQGWMASTNLVDSVNYIVTTKGCPLRISTSTWDHFDSVSTYLSGQSSFEDCLALMNGGDSTLTLSVKTSSFPQSRYFNSRAHFKRDPVVLPMYLVTRLDAYTIDQVKSYLDRASQPAILGDGLWVLDVEPGKDGNPGYKIGNDWLRNADSILNAHKLNILFNTDTLYLRNQKDVIGYASWGSNDSYSGGGAAAKPGNTWLNASIAETFVSTGGRSFMTGTGYGQSLVADWIAEGVCGIKGYTDEPYLTAIAHPDILFSRYVSGFNMAESFFAASQYCAWRQVVIGDPKMKIGMMARLSAMAVDFGSVPRYLPRRDTLWIANNLSIPMIVSGVTLSGSNAGDFSVATTGSNFPLTLAPHDSVGLIFAFSTKVYGARTAKATIGYRRSTEQSDLLVDIPLTGTGVHPTLDAPASVEFSGVSTGSTAQKEIVLTNLTSSDTITVSTATIIGAASSAFTVQMTEEVPHVITGDGTWALTIGYTATAKGNDTATLRITSNAVGTVTKVLLVGNAMPSGVQTVSVIRQPDAIALEAVPNPFDVSADLRYAVPAGGADITIELIDPLGRTVATLNQGMQREGAYSAGLDGSRLAAGVYLCRITAAGRSGIRSTAVTMIRR